MSEAPMPRILMLVSDLYFSVQIESVARNLGYGVESLDGAREDEEFAQWVGELQPVLIVLDLNNPIIPWEAWIRAVKAEPTTQDVPVLSFGSHKEVEVMRRAKKAGVEAVLAKSRFTKEMPELIEKYARGGT